MRIFNRQYRALKKELRVRKAELDIYNQNIDRYQRILAELHNTEGDGNLSAFANEMKRSIIDETAQRDRMILITAVIADQMEAI